MDIDDLVKELETLKRQREEMVANINAVGGAIQFAEAMIAKMKAVPPADARTLLKED